MRNEQFHITNQPPTLAERSRSAIESETAHFCTVEQLRQKNAGVLGWPFDDARWHARIPNCGIATALLQYNLNEYYDIPTERVITTPPQAPRSQYSYRRFRHVMLRYRDDSSNEYLIDPTYGQFFRWLGFRQPTAEDIPGAPTEIFPDNLTLIVDLNNPDLAIDSLKRALTNARAHYPVNYPSYRPLHDASDDQLKTILADIYNPDQLQPFRVGYEDQRSHQELRELSQNIHD